MYNCEFTLEFMGEAPTAESDQYLIDLVKSYVDEICELSYRKHTKMDGSEDLTYMMKRVQENDGLAVNIGIGSTFGQLKDDEKIQKKIFRQLTYHILILMNGQ